MCLFLLAFGLRVVDARAKAREPLGGDEIEYVALAKGLLKHGGYLTQPGFNPLFYGPIGAPTAVRSPGLPVALAGVFSVFSTGDLAARIFLAFWNAIGAVLLVLVAQETSTRRGFALAAGFLWAVWPASVLDGSTVVLTESLVIPILWLGVWLLMRFAKGSVSSLLLAGLTMGLCAMVRSNLLLLIPVTMAWIMAATPGRLSTRFRATLLFGAFAALVLLPWVLRNHRVLGVYALATQSDVLFVGNNAWARGSFDGEYFAGQDSRQVRWLLERHPDLPRLSEADKLKVYAGEAATFARDNPGRMTWLLWRKAILFCSPVRDSSRGYYYDAAFATLLPLCFVGLAALPRRGNAAYWLLLAPLVVALASCLIVFFMPRYRLPAEPGMIILALLGVTELVRRFGPRPVTRTVVLLLLANIVISLIS